MKTRATIMNFMIKNIPLLAISIITCLSSQLTMSLDQQKLPATFKIIPHADWTNKYEAKITLVNNTDQKFSNGWQLQFNFSSPDQTITKIRSGVTTIRASNPIIITNTPQHIRTQVGGTRTITITVNKNPNTIPEIPTITAIAFDNPNNRPLTLTQES